MTLPTKKNSKATLLVTLQLGISSQPAKVWIISGYHMLALLLVTETSSDKSSARIHDSTATLVSAASSPAPGTSWTSNSYEESRHSVQERRNILEAHAALGSLSWIFILPLGANFFKVLDTPRLFWIHTVIPTLGMVRLTFP